MGLDGTAIFVNGTVGVGKTTTTDAMAEILTARKVPHAVIDLDRIRHAWPAPPGDPFNHRLELKNLRSLASNYAAAGASTLLLAGVLEQKAAITRYEQALTGYRLIIVRLTADEEIRKTRITARHIADPAGLQWHLHRTTELHHILDSEDLNHVLIDNSHQTPHHTATMSSLQPKPPEPSPPTTTRHTNETVSDPSAYRWCCTRAYPYTTVSAPCTSAHV